MSRSAYEQFARGIHPDSFVSIQLPSSEGNRNYAAQGLNEAQANGTFNVDMRVDPGSASPKTSSYTIRARYLGQQQLRAPIGELAVGDTVEIPTDEGPLAGLVGRIDHQSAGMKIKSFPYKGPCGEAWTGWLVTTPHLLLTLNDCIFGSGSGSRSDDRHLMEAAIAEMRLSTATPKVGAVIADASGEVVAAAYKVKTEGIDAHAERIALDQLDDEVQRPLTLFTTLEPCTDTKSNCAQAIIDAGIETVVIGRYDMNTKINLKGKQALQRGGIATRDFDADLRNRCDDINSEAVLQYQKKVGPTGHGKYGYTANGTQGVLSIRFSGTDARMIGMAFSDRDEQSVYAWGRNGVQVASTGAHTFSEIDDPTAYDAGFSHQAAVKKGEIAIFNTDDGAILVHIKKIHAAEHAVTFRFEVRPR